jgi:hypothetical protein
MASSFDFAFNQARSALERIMNSTTLKTDEALKELARALANILVMVKFVTDMAESGRR